MNRKKLTQTFMMIQIEKKPLVSTVFTKIVSALRVKMVREHAPVH